MYKRKFEPNISKISRNHSCFYHKERGDSREGSPWKEELLILRNRPRISEKDIQWLIGTMSSDLENHTLLLKPWCLYRWHFAPQDDPSWLLKWVLLPFLKGAARPSSWRVQNLVKIYLLKNEYIDAKKLWRICRWYP